MVKTSIPTILAKLVFWWNINILYICLPVCVCILCMFLATSIYLCVCVYYECMCVLWIYLCVCMCVCVMHVCICVCYESLALSLSLSLSLSLCVGTCASLKRNMCQRNSIVQRYYSCAVNMRTIPSSESVFFLNDNKMFLKNVLNSDNCI